MFPTFTLCDDLETQDSGAIEVDLKMRDGTGRWCFFMTPTALAALSPHPVHAPEPYWKEPGWYEHAFQLTPADQPTFDALVALSEGDWEVSRGDTQDSECDAVWNPWSDHPFLLPGVTWAHILLIYPNPPAPDQECLPL